MNEFLETHGWQPSKYDGDSFVRKPGRGTLTIKQAIKIQQRILAGRNVPAVLPHQPQVFPKITYDKLREWFQLPPIPQPQPSK